MVAGVGVVLKYFLNGFSGLKTSFMGCTTFLTKPEIRLFMS